MMYDNVRLWADSTVVGEHFLPTIANYLDNVKTTVDDNTGEVINTAGYLNGLKVQIFGGGVSITNSWAKYLYGNNINTLNRQTTAQVIEKLSDTLHFHVGKANVIRLEFGTNLIMNNPVFKYLSMLGDIPYLSRFQCGIKTLYYMGNGKRHPKVLRFYDKIAEAKASSMTVPTEYEGTNLFRYEMEYDWRLPQQFKVPEVKASTLADKDFYRKMIDIYQKKYFSIHKRKQLKRDAIDNITTTSDAYDAYVWFNMSHVDITLQDEFLKSIKDSHALSSKYYSRLKKKIDDVYKRFTESDELVKELDDKIREVSNYE